MYKDSDLHEEKSRISQALGSIKDEKLLQKVLDFAMSVSKLSTYVPSLLWKCYWTTLVIAETVKVNICDILLIGYIKRNIELIE